MSALRASIVLLAACAGANGRQPSSVETTEPLAKVTLRTEVQTQHFLTLPVTVHDQPTIAILDTGIGLALISQGMCERIGCTIDGEFTGRRMSGQAVTIPTTTLQRLEVGGVQKERVAAGVVDIEGFFPDPRIEVFVGLPFFEGTPFTLTSEHLIIESEQSLRAREQGASSSRIRLDRQGIALDVFAPVRLSDGTQIEVLMDTGSHGVTLHTRYAESLGIDLEAGTVERREGRDETGHTYTRYFTTLGKLAFVDAPARSADNLRVMFQEIIHDGLVGVQFMEQFEVTFDLARSRVLLR
jgi:predicted aspartyl protease